MSEAFPVLIVALPEGRPERFDGGMWRDQSAGFSLGVGGG
ncbi:hypothetical protein FHR97_000549 [Halomonas stenophila]|uniref:Uncharacterized protein n=1 Tax=Halomonas stenophila TaxID=795312 RepID=A0A7W5HK58_9GAMM|nr:hypothetical protein [Halomonas stenophila]